MKYKVENNEKTQNVIDDAKKVAVAGLQGKFFQDFNTTAVEVGKTKH